MGVGLALGIAGAAAGVAGAAGSMSGGGVSSANKLINQGTRGTARAYEEYLPWQLGFNQQYNPMLYGQQGQDLQTLLFGAPASSQTLTGRFYDMDRRKWRTGSQTYDMPEQPGIVGTLGRLSTAMQGIEQDSATRARQADIDALNQFMPQARAAYEASTPEQAALRTALSRSAMQQLGLGGQIAPDDSYRITSGVRNDWANRGLGATNPAMLSEAMQLFGGGEQLRAQRQDFGLNTLDALARTQPDYAAFILNQRGNLGNTMGMLGMQQPIAYQGLQWSPWDKGQESAQSAAAMEQRQAEQRAGGMMGMGMGMLDLGSTLYQYRTPKT